MKKENLLLYANNKYSQAGQDGLIERIFSVLKIRAGHFVEFGACDGVYLSNCKKLYEEGWSGVFIESDASLFQKLRQNYNNAKNITCLNEKVAVSGPQTLENILNRHGLDKPITFLSIDIDGFDLEIFDSLETNLPLVVCLEGGMGPSLSDPKMPLYMIGQLGQSLSVIDRTARNKGYMILCAFQDVFLIKKDYYEQFNTSEDLIELYKNGYKKQPQFIPLYAQRLRIYHRKNLFLEAILKKTNYCAYKSDNYWLVANQFQIASLIDFTPNSILTQCPGKFALSESLIWSYSRMVLKKILGRVPYLKTPIKVIENYLIRLFFK